MATRTAKKFDDLGPDSGIPKKHRLGASKGEMAYLLLGLLIVLAIIAAFMFEAYR